jgi:hypothetical protein
MMNEPVNPEPHSRVKEGEESKKRKRKTRLIHILITLILILCLGEVLFRIILPLPEISNFNRIMYTPLKTTEEFARQSRLSNASYYSTSDPDGVEVVNTLNLYGFRDKDWKVEKKARRVIFIGDSITEGFMAGDNETIPVGFATSAEKEGVPLEVMNLGISATKFHHYFKLIRDALPLFQPDDVILIFSWNDFPPADYDPAWLKNPLIPHFHSSLPPRFFQVLAQVIRGEPVVTAWKSKPFQFFAPVPNPVNPWTTREARYSAFVEPGIARAMKNGRFNPFLVNEIGGTRGLLLTPIHVEQHLAALKQYAARYNASIFFVYVPSRLQVSDYYLQFAKRFSREDGKKSLRDARFRGHALTLGETARSLSLPFLDLTPTLEAREERGTHCYWEYDPHLRGDGYLFSGQIIYSWWKGQKKE